MRTENEIRTILSQQMHGTWDRLDEVAQLACLLSFAIGDRMGYEEGFQVGSAAERGIVAMQTRFDQIDNSTDEPAPVPPKDLAHSAGAGSVHPIFETILNTLTTVPGSGYERGRK